MVKKIKKIVFYTTYSCYLCEEVEKMLLQFFSINDVFSEYELQNFDIVDEKKILEIYRTTIPVLKDLISQKELAWPFTFSELEQWLKNCSSDIEN